MHDDPDLNYRPKSPDLSSFNRHQAPRLPSNGQKSGIPTAYPLGHRASYDASPYFRPATAQSLSYFGQQPCASPSQTIGPPNFSTPQTYLPQSRSLSQPLAAVAPRILHSHSFTQPPPSALHYPPQDAMPRRRAVDDEGGYTPESIDTADGRTSRKRKSEPLSESGCKSPTGDRPSMGIEVKTKFPVARIKRIMQADEDVGKVAQATPTAVSKALELFMVTLVTKAATEARDRSSKRVTAAHLKQAIMKDDNLDFLKEIADKVTDPSENKTQPQSDSAVGADGGTRKRARGAGRTKRVEVDEGA